MIKPELPQTTEEQWTRSSVAATAALVAISALTVFVPAAEVLADYYQNLQVVINQ